MLPGDVAVEDVHCWVAPRLSRRRRVLEVGCGGGELARLLAGDGLDVTAIDVDLGDHPADDDGVRWVEADLLAFEDEPFDSVLFTRSLHHIHPLDRALDRAVHLLRPGGLLLVDEFDREAPDLGTARWYYEAQDLLVAAGLYDADHIHGEPEDDPGERWYAEHDHSPPLHTGGEMLAAISDRFTRLDTQRGPYLYRSIAARLEASQRGVKTASQLYGAETRRLQSAALVAVGLRISALAPS
jgi:SAM-dependent methyltransferase